MSWSNPRSSGTSWAVGCGQLPERTGHSRVVGTVSRRSDPVGNHHGRLTSAGRRVRPVTTVLLAEDDQAISDPLSRALEREGYQVLVAADGNAALSAALYNDVNLVILDLGLPGTDGLEICRRIRSAGRDLLVLML